MQRQRQEREKVAQVTGNRTAGKEGWEAGVVEPQRKRSVLPYRAQENVTAVGQAQAVKCQAAVLCERGEFGEITERSAMVARR